MLAILENEKCVIDTRHNVLRASVVSVSGRDLIAGYIQEHHPDLYITAYTDVVPAHPTWERGIGKVKLTNRIKKCKSIPE